MKTSENRTSRSFEDQLRQSARRLREKQNYQLPLRSLPRRRVSWGWVSTVAAALVGWIVGISFPVSSRLSQSEMAVVSHTDTVVEYKEKLVRDTIIKEVKVPVKVEVPVEAPKEMLKEGTVGCNVECDGIDYALLVGRM